MSRDPARLRGQMTVLAIVSIALVATIAVPTNARLPWLIYNASGSAQLGFYGVENRTPSRRDMVVVRNHQKTPREPWFPARGVPLLKRAIAVGGDQICRFAGVVYVNGIVAAEALDHDREGRPLPFRRGCARLFEGHFFVVQPHPYSFDSRYFGPVSDCQIIGVARPLWTWNPPQ
jgi:conjugative transfer signal peptidase TraF